MDHLPLQVPQSIQGPILGIIVAYIIGMALIGYYFHRRGMENIQDFFLAGKGAPWYLVALSFFATAIGAGGTIGLTGDTYVEESITVFWSYGIIVVGYFITAFLLGHKLPTTTGITIPEMLEDRYNEQTRVIAVPFYILRLTSALAAQWIAGGVIISFILGDIVTVQQGILIGAIIVALYTGFGGMFAVLWTDAIQAAIIFVGLWILTIVGIQDLGGWSATVSQVSVASPQAFDIFATEWTLIAGFVVTLLPTILVRQQYLQRIMAARSPRDGFIGVFLNGVIASIFIVVPLLLGVMGLVMYRGGFDNPDHLLPTMILDLLPTWLAGFLMAGLIAAIMSSGDSALLSGSSNITQDIYLRYIEPDAGQRKEQWASRVSVVLLMVISVFLTTVVPGIIDLLVFGALALTAGVLVPWLGVFFWPRATADAAFWSIALGSSTAIIWWWIGYFAGTEEYLGLHPVFIGLPLSIIIFISVSYLQDPEYEKVINTAQKHNLDDLEEKTRKAMKEIEE